MTIVAGYAPEGRGKAARAPGQHAGALIERRADGGAAIPAPWIPEMAKVDAEYRECLDQTEQDALDRAQANLPADQAATFVRHSAGQPPSGCSSWPRCTTRS